MKGDIIWVLFAYTSFANLIFPPSGSSFLEEILVPLTPPCLSTALRKQSTCTAPIPRSLGPRGRISLGPPLLSSSSLSLPPRVVVDWAPKEECKMTSPKSLVAHHLHMRWLGIWNIPDHSFISSPLPHRGFLDFFLYQSLFPWNMKC